MAPLCYPSPLSPGYMVSAIVLFLIMLIIFFTTFNFWWLSYWLQQGSGVSVMGGVRCVSVGWYEVGHHSFDPTRVRAWVREPHGKPGVRHCQVNKWKSSREDLGEPEHGVSLPASAPCVHRMSGHQCCLIRTNQEVLSPDRSSRMLYIPYSDLSFGSPFAFLFSFI